MTTLPITRMILYKHGVGYFERRAQFSGEQVTLSFRVEEMNDVLKSLTPIDWGAGQVLGVEYATPQERDERLAGCSVELSDERSLQDLLVSLRGRRVTLQLDQSETLTGAMLGIDSPLEEQPLNSALVSLLADDRAEVRTVTLGRVQGVDILDSQGAADLRFFLQTSLNRERYNQVIIRLSAGDHDLSVGYIAPAPTWRVSYRLVASSAQGNDAQALLLGWGIFDNRLEEDLSAIHLSLVAGMPVSFVYDLYTPFTPTRPEVREEGRTVARPVEFEPVATKGMAMRSMRARESEAPQAMAAFAPAPLSPEAIEASTPLQAAGKAMGELFQYDIGTPVSVGRGQSAMAPIVSARLACSKALIYNSAQMPKHPVATLRLRNETGLALERGPITVIDNGEYVGEALLAFTPAGGEIVVPHAVELGVIVSEQSGRESQLHSLQISGRYLSVEEWDVRWREVRVNNATAKPVHLLVEHPRQAGFDLFDSPQAVEMTVGNARFAVEAPAVGEVNLRLQERRLVRRREEIGPSAAKGLRVYLNTRLLSSGESTQLEEMLALWAQVAIDEQRLKEIEQERVQIYKAQEQMRANLQSLSNTGKEGSLRASYVDKLQASEEQLQGLARAEAQIKADIAKLNATAEGKLAGG
jgi:hypothetical protein